MPHLVCNNIVMNKAFSLFSIQQVLCYLNFSKQKMHKHFSLKQNTGKTISVKQLSHLWAGLSSLRRFCRQGLSLRGQTHHPALLLQSLIAGLTVPYRTMVILTSLTSFYFIQKFPHPVWQRRSLFGREFVNSFLIVTRLTPKLILLFLDYFKNVAPVKWSQMSCTQVNILVQQGRAENSPSLCVTNTSRDSLLNTVEMSHSVMLPEILWKHLCPSGCTQGFVGGFSACTIKL